METDAAEGGKAWERLAYSEDPDFTRPFLRIPRRKAQDIFERLGYLYGERAARKATRELARLLRVHHAHKPIDLIEAEKTFDSTQRFSERDMILITYGDMVQAEERSPWAALTDFLQTLHRRAPVFNTLHLLPFFPYSSDCGFSITDFRRVDPLIGSWKEVGKIGRSFRLMFDGVFNHVSSKSSAFREMLSGNPDYKDFAVTFRSKEELTPEQRLALRRPRTTRSGRCSTPSTP